jgi:hypothetical protein
MLSKCIESRDNVVGHGGCAALVDRLRVLLKDPLTT